jgi:hypothetical protein
MILIGDGVTCIMSTQLNDHSIVDVTPIGVVFGLLGQEGDSCHKCERFGKIGEQKFPTKAIVDLDPTASCHGNPAHAACTNYLNVVEPGRIELPTS